MTEPSIIPYNPPAVIIHLQYFKNIDFNVICPAPVAGAVFSRGEIANKQNRKIFWLDNIIYDFFSLVMDSQNTSTFLQYLHCFDFQTSVKDIPVTQEQMTQYINMVVQAYSATFFEFVSLGYIVNGKFPYCYVQRVGLDCKLVYDDSTPQIDQLIK